MNDKQKDKKTAAKSRLLSQDVFIGLMIWMGVVTVITIITMCYIMLDEDNSKLRRMRDAHFIEDRYMEQTF